MLVCTFICLLIAGHYATNANGSPQMRPDTIMGDIKLTPKQSLALKLGKPVGVSQKHGYAIHKDVYLRWPNAIIPYQIDCSLEFMPTAIKSVKDAMAVWEKKTCLKFVERTTEKDYLEFFRDTHCWGHVGRIGGASRISIGDGCDYQHVMEHEIGHTVGFYHEQNRMDRDKYVKIHWENIDPWVKSAFDLVKETYSAGIPYDYASIMHYPWNAFSMNGKDTMTPLKPVAIQPYLGLSDLDAKQTSLMYDCPAVLKKRAKARGRRDVNANQNGICKDLDKNCVDWVNAGHCSISSYVLKNCALSCKVASCDLIASCVDEFGDCPKWESWGHCRVNPTVMKRCSKSCSPACKSAPTSSPVNTAQTTAVPVVTNPSQQTTPGAPYTGTLPTTSSGTIRLGTGKLCMDLHSKCAEWAQSGECQRNPGYMLRNCQISCNSTDDCETEIARPPGQCADPLGLAFDGKGYKIPDSNMKSASHLAPGSNWKADAKNARLYYVDDHDQKRIGAWCVASWDDFRAGAFIEIDLGQTRKVRYIATQGRHKYFERVSKFKISHSMDGSTFTDYQENGKLRIFNANCDHFTPILNQFNTPFTAQHIRLYPTEANYPCIRMEFYGC